VTVVDGHVTIGASRDASLDAAGLLRTMDALAIDHALISPPEGNLPVRNREGNELVARAAAAGGGRLLAYAVATPWLGAEAIEELERAHEAGARALKLDPALQGFDLLDGSVDALVAFAVAAGWPVYVRTGTPPHSLPLQVALLASRFPQGSFVLGKSGATDFSHDGPAALAFAGNLYADSAHVEWPTALAVADAAAYGGRVVLTTDAPFAEPAIELARVTEAPLSAVAREAVLGGTLSRLLGL
jgi:predicted TIM-barrel fold metal-dependent hydrolase